MTLKSGCQRENAPRSVVRSPPQSTDTVPPPGLTAYCRMRAEKSSLPSKTSDLKSAGNPQTIMPPRNTIPPTSSGPSGHKSSDSTTPPLPSRAMGKRPKEPSVSKQRWDDIIIIGCVDDVVWLIGDLNIA